MTAAVQERSALSRFFRDRDGHLVVWQWPNLPLWLWIGATALRLLLHPTGGFRTALDVVGTAALVIWSVLEIASGASPFRRVLGAVVLLGIVSRCAW